MSFHVNLGEGGVSFSCAWLLTRGHYDECSSGCYSATWDAQPYYVCGGKRGLAAAKGQII